MSAVYRYFIDLYKLLFTDYMCCVQRYDLSTKTCDFVTFLC